MRDAASREVRLYTDGSCLGNPGPGGYGAILDFRGQRKELAEGYRLTTNNRMELLAVIEGLAALKRTCSVTVYSDSEYVVKAMKGGWPHKWKRNGWKRKGNKPAVNPDLWEQLLTLCERHEVEFVWVRGHSGHPENERCDALANQAARAVNLLEDEGYAGPLSYGAGP